MLKNVKLTIMFNRTVITLNFHTNFQTKLYEVHHPPYSNRHKNGQYFHAIFLNVYAFWPFFT